MNRSYLRAVVLLLAVFALFGGLATWKYWSIREAMAEFASQPEPMESISVAKAKPIEHRETTTSIGTVLALRSIRLRNELAGTVREVMLTPGEIVEEGTVLVRLDTSVEEAELLAQRAQAAVADSLLGRVERAVESRAASAMEVDQARAEKTVALAQIARTQAVIAKKTIRAPFRARVGIADVHPGQYLDEGTELTTLQGVDDAAHVDFTVAQRVAAALHVDDAVDVFAGREESPIRAKIVAIDARVDPTTRNAMVRARIEGAENAPSPGASVRVQVPVGVARKAVSVPVSALRKGPGGDHVFVIAADKEGKTRAQQRAVQSGAMLDDSIVILDGLEAGESVAASGAFKLREAVLVAVADPEATAGEKR